MGDPHPGLWTHPRLLAALAAEDWGAVFRAYRGLTGLSQTRLGALVGLAQPDVSEVERGHRRVTSAEVRDRIVSGLGVPERVRPGAASPPLLPVPGLAPDSEQSDDGFPDGDLLERITGVVDGSRRADGPTLDWLEKLLAEHRRAEDFIGARPLVAVMREQLRTVVGLYGGARGSLAERVVRLAAEHAQFLAWMAQDQGATARALAWYDRSHEWALEAGDADMAATTLSMKAHLAWSKGRAERCVRLAEAARSSAPEASSAVRGMAAQMAGRGHALAGTSDAAHRLLDEAQLLVGRAAERPEDNPPWLYFYDETWFTLQRGMAALHLRDWSSAAERLTAGLDALDTSYRRDRAWYAACLAHAHAGAGDAGRALSVARATVPDAAEVGRPHAWGELHAAAAVLRRGGAPESGRLVELLRAYD
ncbi:helix-turn-helix domain-containing protein [Streptomyces cacaoi]|uniref:helix-turn-helix domain-containing protein n=1 Tax=Streptomyces cacaoi TaxID=1898 RepID=UPI0011F10F45|nr:helix-turn-helix domain-containing protein [Streptomyces cacaoi]